MSGLDVIIRYQTATANLYKFWSPILIILGSIGSFLCILVFRQKSMRKSVISTYFVAFYLANILSLWIALGPFVHRYTTGFDLTVVNLFYCRLRTYLLNVLIMLPPSYLILASVDRVLITSRSVSMRQRSTRRFAFFTIGGITFFWLLYYIHIWLLVYIQPIGPGMQICFFEFGPYSTFISYSTMTVSGFLPPLLMGIFGIMTMKNFRGSRIRPAAQDTNQVLLSSKDQQIGIVILFEILISVIFSTIGSILYVYTQRMPNDSKTLEQQALDYFLLDFGLNLVFIQAAISGYLNILVSKRFRSKIRKLLRELVHCRLGQTLLILKGNHASNSIQLTATCANHQGHSSIQP